MDVHVRGAATRVRDRQIAGGNADARKLAGAPCTFRRSTSPTLTEKVRDADAAPNERRVSQPRERKAPTVAPPTLSSKRPVRMPDLSVTLTNISFTDPGTIDRPWTDRHRLGRRLPRPRQLPDDDAGVTDAADQHVYATSVTFTAKVSVTDKDADEAANTGSANSTNTTQVYPVCGAVPPADRPVDSPATSVIDNKMKNGRVVPVKITIRDLSVLAPICTDPNADVTIKVTKAHLAARGSGIRSRSMRPPTPANSNGGTNQFRWSGEHWIYNLDSKAMGLTRRQAATASMPT